MRRYHKSFIVAVALTISFEVFGYIALKSELTYLNGTIKGVSEQYRDLSRLTKSLLRGERGKPLQKDPWIMAWKAYDKGVRELGTQRYQLFLTEDIKTSCDTILLFWRSSQMGFNSAVEKIELAFPKNTTLPSSTGIFPLLDEAKLKGDSPAIILYSEMVSNLISFNVFAKEIMQIELLQLDKEINEHIERINYFYWLQLSLVLFGFFISSIILIFVRLDPVANRRKRLRKAKKLTKTKRKPPRILNHE
ncbi:hypothetical protein [Kiloniella sp.]|uniref:hypothetical protein n=1 Tax=Kiloniella sp. TaxID=1938587 RepID=UPI003B02A293